MFPLSYPPNPKIPTLKLSLKYHKEILYAINAKNKGKLKTNFQG